ncbi:hypothetical protein [Stutzerimonas frequens]|uniref:hypothetical protein n=1 Tax=Stutzerimonas frequens TaxID=2968969 RepID=UPI001AAFB57D|nr:hypothetical protein [Stutzerimonas frequens]QTF59123.1 hypothetical protein J4H94_20750 [Stutzerimonas frequens]
MNDFKQLLAAYLAAHPNILPSADPEEEVRFERDGLEWKVTVRNGGEIFDSTVDCESLLGWLWLQQSGQPKS